MTRLNKYGNDLSTYISNGNVTSANNRTFIYDLSNRLIRVEDNGTTIAEYGYNANNQRIKKIVQGTTRIFHYDLAGYLIAETNDTGQTLAEYIYIGDQPIVMIRPGEAAYYYHNDHLGTPQILTDEAGTVSWKAVYTPFGEADISIGTVENPFRFPGQYYDTETGLHYNWNRYYDPKTGRYLTPDPIGLEGGINVFVYGKGNPISKIDPRGLFSIDKECCKKDPTLRKQIENACQMVNSNITDPKLRDCLVNRCKEASVSCDGLFCWIFDTTGWQNRWYGSNITLCLSKNEFIGGIGQWGCVAIHEWAHSCGWEPGQGGGVPGDSGGYDPNECKNWNPYTPIKPPRPNPM